MSRRRLPCARALLLCGVLLGAGPAAAPASAARHHAHRARPAFPSARAVASARRYLAHRRGRTSFAVKDTRGHLHGVRIHARFVSASVVKAMLLVAFLRKLAREHRPLGLFERALLEPMIHVSDNAAASVVWHRVGNPALRRLARRAGMTDFSIVGDWAHAQISAADQARFFREQESLLPRYRRAYARSLLGGITPSQSWEYRASRAPPFTSSSRAAGEGPVGGSSCTRPRGSSATAGASASRSSPTGTRPWATASTPSKA